MDPLSESYRAGIAHVEDLVVATDAFQEVASVETAPIRVLNYRLLSRAGLSLREVEQWEGRPIGQFLKGYALDAGALSAFWDQLRSERFVAGIPMPFAPAGKALHLEVAAQVLPGHGGGYFLLAIFRDLTRLKEAEAALAREREDRWAWDAFLRHELRGKLGPISGFAELLAANYERFPPEKAREFLSSIMVSADRLNQILDVSKEVQAYERGEIPVPMKDQDVFEAVRGAILEATTVVRRVTADHPAHCRVLSEGDMASLRVRHDSLKLQRALRDLLINAWEHAKGEAVLRVADGTEGVVIRIQNPGPPIPPERLSRIFDRFNSTKSGRMGLGTTVARLLVEAQGGQISAASSPSDGTTFTIRLPKT